MADGSLLIKTRFAETEQLHRVAAAGAAREQLTFGADAVEWARAARAGGGAVYWMDKGGDDNFQMYYLGANGQSRALTNGDFIHGSLVWAHDGKHVAFYGNDRDGLSYDVYVADVSTATPPQLLIGGQEDTWYPLDWSADDSKLLVWKYLSSTESYLYLADMATGTLTPLEAKSHGRRHPPRASSAADGRGVYVLTDEDGEVAAVHCQRSHHAREPPCHARFTLGR